MTALNERIFEIINGTLYCFFKALSESGLSEKYYRNLKWEDNKRLQFLDHPMDKRFSLVAFDTISQSHQEKIRARFGNPYEFVTRDPIIRMITRNIDTYQKFLDYRYADNKMLPIHRVRQYSRACDMLDLLIRVEESRNKIVKELGITVPQFYDHLKAIILEEQRNGQGDTYEGNNQLYARFPFHYVSLRDKVKEYKQQGYACVIDKAYGNTSALKIKDEVAEAHLLTLIENPNQYDDVLVCMMYNTWAEKNQYKSIDPGTVGVWRRKKGYLVTMGREGNNANNERYLPQVKGLVPSVPLALVEHDDNNLDFLFSDGNNYDFNKYVAICVFDSRTKLLLGKSYIHGRQPETWQVQHAYIDAMYYIRNLTGGWHLPFEIKADKWALKTLSPFYEKIARYVVPGHSNKHRGYLEQYFGSPLWKRAQKLVSQNNYTGNNMTAKSRGINEDVLRGSARMRPVVGSQAEIQIENFFRLIRTMPDIKRGQMNNPSKEQQFMDQWNGLKAEDKRPISDEQFLLTFGITHQPQGRSITITNRGVEPQINNQKFSFDLPESWMYEKLIGASVSVIYDPFDLSRVLVTNNAEIRFIARTAQLQPRALKDQYTGSRTFLNALLTEKKDQVSRTAAAAQKRRDLVDDNLFDAEAILQGGVLLKELKNEAEHRMLEGTNDAAYDPLDDM